MTGFEITNLDSITRKGEQFFARYEWQEVKEVIVAHPVYTGNAKNEHGDQNVSRVTRHFSTAKRTHTVQSIVEISKVDAQFAVTTLPTLSKSQEDGQNWTVFLGGAGNGY